MALSAMDRNQIASEILEKRHHLAEYAAEEVQKSAYWSLRYGEQGRVTCYNDNLKNIEVLSLSIRNKSPMIADTHVEWLRGIYTNLGLCSVYLVQTFGHMQRASQEFLTPQTAEYFNEVLERGKRGLVHQKPISQAIRQHQDALVEMVVDAMYNSIPYWGVRYGERGRSSCAIDTYYNIAYIADALESDNTKGILIHTKWMRTFLVSRGMCTEYYADALRILIEAIVNSIPSQFHAELRALEDALMNNLAYNHPFETLLKASWDATQDTIVARTYDTNPLLSGRLSRHDYLSDIHYKLSYLMDSVCLNNPSIFNKFIEWSRPVLPQLGFTLTEMESLLNTMQATLPAGSPPEAASIIEAAKKAPSNAQLQQTFNSLTSALWQKLHGASSFWSVIFSQQAISGWEPILQSFVLFMADGYQTNNLVPTYKWMLKQLQQKALSPAYLLDFMDALDTLLKEKQLFDVATQLETLNKEALDTLADEDPALALMTMPGLAQPIIQNLRTYSPYWQIDYQRRSQENIKGDVLVLLGTMANELMEIGSGQFISYVDLQRQYLMTQGICTAYYQQIIDLVTETIQPLLDPETAEQAVILLDAANANLESDNPYVLAVAAQQDNLVEFVTGYLKQKHPQWVSNYPGGWNDATTDLYYWLGYLTDAVNFNNPDFVVAHIAWLYEYGLTKNQGGDMVKVSLVALGHAIKQHMPQESPMLLGILQKALARF